MTDTLPPQFLERLQEIIPAEYQSQADLSFSQKEKVSFRINTLRMTIKDAHEALQNAGISFETHPLTPSAVMVAFEHRSNVLNLNLEGRIYAQSLESMAAVVALDPHPNERILDLCAAPGSKTTFIAAMMGNQGELWANEAVRNRVYKLRNVLEMMGAQAKVVSVDGRRFQAPAAFDRVLVDAPCSSEGRFDIHEPKSIGFWSKRKIEEMSHKQKGLLANAVRCLKPGGVLVYSTCTFAPEENEEVIDWLLRRNLGIEIEHLNLPGISTYPCIAQWGKRPFDSRVLSCTRILPTSTLGGFFIAKLKKV